MRMKKVIKGNVQVSSPKGRQNQIEMTGRKGGDIYYREYDVAVASSGRARRGTRQN